MNLTVLLIAVYLPLLPVLFFILRSGAFGKGSVGTFLKLFFLGVAAAVPAFLMEAGGMLAVTVLLRILFPQAEGGGLLVVSSILRYVIAAALIEEAWKHFVLRTTTWKQMTMESIGDGTAASAAVGAGFAVVMYAAWQAGYHFIPTDMESIRSAMPDFLSAGAVVAFIHALLFIPSHFGYAGFMGLLYGVAKKSDQKSHSGRAGFMLTMSFLLPTLVHGICEGLVGYGMASEKILWLIPGFAAEAILALIIAIVLSGARDAALTQHAGAAAGAQTETVETEPAFGEAEAGTSDDQSLLTMDESEAGDLSGEDAGTAAQEQFSADDSAGADAADGFMSADPDLPGPEDGFPSPDADSAGQDLEGGAAAEEDPPADPGTADLGTSDPGAVAEDDADHPVLKW